MRTKVRIKYTSFIGIGVIFVLALNSADAQVLTGRIGTSIYNWERQDSPLVSTMHLRFYQLVNFKLTGLTGNRLSIHTGIAYSTDLSNAASNDPRTRIVNLHLKYKAPYGVLLYAGRQRVYSNSVTVAFDGIRLKYNAVSNLILSGYWGANVPADRGLEVRDIRENQVLGFQSSYRNFFGSDISIAYSDVRREPVQYSTLGVITQKILQKQSTQERFLSGEVRKQFTNNFDIRTRLLLNYGLPLVGSGTHGFRRFQRFELTGNYKPGKDITIKGKYIIRRPRLNENSIFWVFNQKPNTEIGSRVYYHLNQDISMLAGIAVIVFEQTEDFETLDRLNITINSGIRWKGSSLGLTRRRGYAGDALSINLSNSSKLSDVFKLRIGSSYSTYKINPEAITDNSSTTAFIGGDIRFSNSVWTGVDLQYLSQNIKSQSDFYGYSSDYRFFIRINYRFRTKIR